jgi:hypothetical protein
MRPVLHDATVQRTAPPPPSGINLRHVAQTRLAMPRRSTPTTPGTTRGDFDIYFGKPKASSSLPSSSCSVPRTAPLGSITTVCGIVVTP